MTQRSSRESDVFFSLPNEIQIEKLPADLRAFVDRAISRIDCAEAERTVLPAKVGTELRWYGISHSASEGRQLREEMAAWLGSPVATSIELVPNDSKDQLDTNALRLAGSNGSVFVARVDAVHREIARNGMRNLLDLWQISPTRIYAAPRPVGRVLRDFYSAILVRDRISADDILEEIRSRGLLSPTNCRFLLVELLGSLGVAEELQNDPRLSGISLLRRPPRVTETLAEAANELMLLPLHTKGNAVREIAITLEDCWPGLVTTPVQVRSVSSARCLAFVESIVDLPRLSVVSYLQENWGSDPLVAAVLGSLPSSAGTPIALSDPLEYLRLGDLEGALTAAESKAPGVQVASYAILAAYELGLAEHAVRALAIVDALLPAEMSELCSRAVQARRVEQLRELSSEQQTARNWLEWLQAPDKKNVGRLDLLREWSTNVSPAIALTSNYIDSLLSELIDALNDDRRAIVRDAIPVIFESLTDSNGLRVEAVRMAIEIVDIMLASGAGAPERSLALEVVDQAFERGCTSTEYERLLGIISGHYGELGARSASFVADSLSLVLEASVLSIEGRARFIVSAFQAASAMLNHLSETDWTILSQVFAVAGSPFPEPEIPILSEIRAGVRSVGLYSLNESAVRRAADWISELFPDVKVKLSNDFVNSDRLVSLVQGVDLMIVQTSKATHAATNAIGTAAAGRTPVVHVAGRGTTAMLRAFLDWSP